MENFSEKIQSLRNEYSDLDLTSEDLNQDPITQFTKWLDEAIETQIYEPNAMVLATVDENAPRSRYVFCLLYTSPSPRDKRQSRMPSSA